MLTFNGDIIKEEDTRKAIDGSFKYLLISRALRSIALSFTTSALPLYLVFVLNLNLIGVGTTYFMIILFVAFTSFFFGILSDRIGYGKTMIIAEILPFLGFAGLVMSTFIIGNKSTDLTVVIISSMLAGISTVGGMRGAFSAGQQALIANNWKDHKDRINRVGRILTIAAIGSIIGSLLLAFQGILTGFLTVPSTSELAASALAFRYLFFVCVIMITLSMLCLFFVKEVRMVKKRALFIKKESSPHLLRVISANLFSSVGIGLALPILPALIAKSYSLHAAIASQFIGYTFGLGYVIIAISSFYMSRLIYEREMHTLKVASAVRVMQGIALVLIAIIISVGGAPYGVGIGLLVLGLLYSLYSMFIGLGVPLRSAINISGIRGGDYGTASAVMGMSMQIPQTSVGLSGFISELLPSFMASPIALGGVFVSIGGIVYWKLLSGSKLNGKIK